MLVKFKYEDVLSETDKGILFLISQKEVWLPKKLVRFLSGRTASCPLFIAQEKGISAKPLYHKPKKIEPIYNAEPIEELKYNPK